MGLAFTQVGNQVFNSPPQGIPGQDLYKKMVTIVGRFFDRPSEFNGLISMGLEKLQDLPQDWNAPKTGLDTHVVNSAFALAKEIESWAINNGLRIPRLHIGPTTKGGIIFEWRGKNTLGRELILTLNPQGKTRFYQANSRGFEAEGEFKTFADLVPKLEWLIG
jgi:hypothetical protein